MANSVGIRSQRRVNTRNKRIKPPIIKMHRGDIDYTFLFMVVLMLSIGLVMLLSASAPKSKTLYDNSYRFFLKQSLAAAIGIAAMYIIAKLDYKSYKKFIPIAIIICIVALVAVLLPGIGVSHNGSRRWLNTPIFEVQPSEFAKPLIAMYLASRIETGKYDLKKPKDVGELCVVLLIILVLMMMETHLSGTIVIAGIGIAVLIAGGVPVKPIIVGGIIIFVVGIFGIKAMSPVRWDRVISFLHPFEDAQNTGYQISQGLYAIGSGKLFGLGLGQSVQKYTYLPEPYNDFIFAVVCEELGLVGASLIIALFAALILRAARIAANAPDVYSSLTATGITVHLAIQTVLNIAVATSSVPNTGVALPFFSYGGTSIITLLAEMGVLLSISRYSVKTPTRGKSLGGFGI